MHHQSILDVVLHVKRYKFTGIHVIQVALLAVYTPTYMIESLHLLLSVKQIRRHTVLMYMTTQIPYSAITYVKTQLHIYKRMKELINDL